MVLNPKKFHFMTLWNEKNLCNFSCVDIIIQNSLSEKLLGLTIDNNLDFRDHICNICKTSNQKLNAEVDITARRRTLSGRKCQFSGHNSLLLDILSITFSRINKILQNKFIWKYSIAFLFIYFIYLSIYFELTIYKC